MRNDIMAIEAERLAETPSRPIHIKEGICDRLRELTRRSAEVKPLCVAMDSVACRAPPAVTGPIADSGSAMAEAAKMTLIAKDIDHTHRIVFANPVGQRGFFLWRRSPIRNLGRRLVDRSGTILLRGGIQWKPTYLYLAMIELFVPRKG